MPAWGSKTELLKNFPLTQSPEKFKKYGKYCEEARKKWITRELNRQSYTYSDAISIATTADI